MDAGLVRECGKGFRPLADYIHAKGLKFGIHIMRGIPRASRLAVERADAREFFHIGARDESALSGAGQNQAAILALDRLEDVVQFRHHTVAERVQLLGAVDGDLDEPGRIRIEEDLSVCHRGAPARVALDRRSQNPPG